MVFEENCQSLGYSRSVLMLVPKKKYKVIHIWDKLRFIFAKIFTTLLFEILKMYKQLLKYLQLTFDILFLSNIL